MSEPGKSMVNCVIERGVATIQMDDGKNNLVTPQLLRELNHALDEAESAGAVVVLTGRESVFSAGFDLGILRTGVRNTFDMLIGGFTLARRLLAFPTPVVIACNGHAIAMGAFIVLAGDYRIGIEGDFKIVANEVRIGLTMPHAAIVICRQRLKPASLSRAVLLAEQHDPQQALASGFFDLLVSPAELMAKAEEIARQCVELDLEAHRKSKLRLRRGLLRELDKAISADRRDFIVQGFKRVLGKKRKA